MSVTPGNDPFSGTNTKNILQHIISPKVVDDGSGGYVVKTDLINIDNAYITNQLTTDSITVQDSVPGSDKLTITTDTTKSYITTTTSTGTRSELVLSGSAVEIDNPDNLGNGVLLLQTDVNGNGYVRAGSGGLGTEDLYLGTQSTNTVSIIQNGNVGINIGTPTTKLHIVGDAKPYNTEPFGDYQENGQFFIQTETVNGGNRRLAMGYSYQGPTGPTDCAVIQSIQGSVSGKPLLLNPTSNSGSGFVGIGNINLLAATGPTGPTEPLQVAGNLLVNGGRLTAHSILVLGPSIATNNYDSCSVVRSTQDTASNSGSELSFWTHPNTSNTGFPTRAITIDSSQNVGIGKQYPTTTLDVNGSIKGSVVGKSTGTVTANNTTQVSVSDINVGADSIILLTVKTPSGANAGQAYVDSKTASSGFTINSIGTDGSVYNYIVLN